MNEMTFKQKLTDLTPVELVSLNAQLKEIAEMSLAHQAFLEDCVEEEVLSMDTKDLVLIEDAYLFLYEAWKIFMKTEKLH